MRDSNNPRHTVIHDGNCTCERFQPVRSVTLFHARRQASRKLALSGLEVLESRELLSTFTVTNLQNAGAGSFRQAIIESNAQAVPNTIDFDVTATIRISRTSLPAITNTVTIDGTSAPSFAGTPVVTVNFQGTRGLKFATGSSGSTLKSLALVKAGNAGVTISASNVTVQGNDIGLLANGKTVAGNRGDGVQINASSHGDLIGQDDPVSSIDYYPTTDVYMSNGQAMPVSGWQGFREGDSSNQYIITGTSDANGLLYIGPISGVGGTTYPVDYPVAAATTIVYGPDNLGDGELRLVGSYTTGTGQTDGFMFQGTVDDLDVDSDYTTIEDTADDATYTYIHSTDGDVAVGNDGDIPAVTDHAFVYSISQNTFTDMSYPGSTSTSAYGVWYNGGASYTICGGYTSVMSDGKSLAAGYLVNINEATGAFTDWARTRPARCDVEMRRTEFLSRRARPRT
jgi:trimeric autotransporter adhesin